MTKGLTLDDLRLVQAIDEAGSLSGAARKLHVNHSTAFRRLAALETRFGAKLFERSRSGYAALPAGEAAICGAATVLDELAGLERRLAGADLRPSGTVRLTTTDTLVELIVPVLGELRRSHPEITVELVIANTFLTLTKRDADIALRPSATAPEQLVGRKLATLATAVYAPVSSVARQNKRAIPELDWIGFDDCLSHLGSARWLAAHVPPERIILRADSLIALRSAVRAGLGAAALPCHLGDSDAELRRLGPPLPEAAVPLWLLTHPDLRRVARIRTVLDAIAEGLARRRRLIEGHLS